MNPYANPYRSHVAAAQQSKAAAPSSSSPSAQGVATTTTHDDDRPIVQALHQLTLSWDDEVFHKFHGELWSNRHPSQWGWSTLALFLEFVFSSRHCEDRRNRAVVLLARLVNDGTEEQAYAMASFRPDSLTQGGNRQSHPSSFTVLDVLSQRVHDASVLQSKVTTNDPKQDAASLAVPLSLLSSLVALSSLWRALDRLDTFLSFSWLPPGSGGAAIDAESPWWLQPQPQPQQQQQGGATCGADATAWMVQIFLAVEALEGTDSDSALPPSNRDTMRLPRVAEMKSVGLRPKDVQIAVLTYLHHIARRDSSSTMLGRPVTASNAAGTSLLTSSEWTQKLFVLASRLCDRDMPRTSYTHLSLAALQLLVGDPQSTSNTTNPNSNSLQPMVSIVARSLLDPTGDRRLPRWASPHHLHHHDNPMYRDDLYKWTFGILVDWTRHLHHALTDVTAASVQSLWTVLLPKSVSGPPSPVPVDVGAALLVVTTHCQAEAREGLELALQERQPAEGWNRSNTSHEVRVQGMETLVGRFIKDPSLGSLLLMNVLVNDGQSTLTHDRWSKALWQVLSTTVPTSGNGAPSLNRLEEYAHMTLRTAADASTAQEKGKDRHIQYAMMHPKLQSLLDLLHGMMTHVGATQGTPFAQTLHTAQAIETLVQVMSPKQAKVDYTHDHGDGDSKSFSLDFDESITPTANNLSRVDASAHMCLQEHELPPVGREPTLRLACANVLADLSHSFLEGDQDDSLTCSRRPLLQARIIEAVNSFVEEMGLGFVMPCQASSNEHSHDNVRSPFTGSLEMTQRRLRLVTTLASSTDNFVYMASLIHRAEVSQLREAHKWQTKSMDASLRVQELLQRQKQFELEKEALENQLVAQRTTLHEQMARFQRNCSQNAKQLVHVHQLEASRAERRAEEVVIRMKDMQDRLAHSERQLESSRKQEAESHGALERAQRTVEELHRNHQVALQQSEAYARELGQATIELQRTKPKVERLMRNETKMLAHIELQDESLLALGESNDALKDSLEALFADTVSLAQLYESREKEEYKSREQEETTIDELTRQLRAERARCAQLEETYKQTEVNNNMLSSKYEKVRKLLEQEREERNSESARFAAEQRKRYGPASYMSHLHPTTGNSSRASDKSSNRDRMRLVLSTDGKENDRSTSSASRSAHSKSSSGQRYR